MISAEQSGYFSLAKKAKGSSGNETLSWAVPVSTGNLISAVTPSSHWYNEGRRAFKVLFIVGGQKRAIWIVVVSTSTNMIKPVSAVHKKAHSHDLFLMGKALEWY